MATELLLHTKKLNLYKTDTNREFIKLLAERALHYAIQPEVNDFCDEHSDPRELYEIAKGITTRGIVYHPDFRGVKMEKIVSPIRMIKRLRQGKVVTGDCDDKVLFLASCLVNRGYEVNIIGACYLKPGVPEGEINHTYLEFKKPEDKNWTPLDPSARTGRFGVKPAMVIPVVKFKVSTKDLDVRKVAEIVDVGESIERQSIQEEIWKI